MNMFFINFIVMAIEAFFLLYDDGTRGWKEEKKKANKRTFVILVTIQWIIIIGLRGDSVGSDTLNYMNMFDDARARSWSAVFNEFKLFTTDFMEGLTNEIGFKIFEKVVGTFTSSHVAYKFIVGSVIMVPFGIFIYRNSTEPFLSFSLFDAILYNLFAITGYRQAISVTISLIIGYEFIKKKKFWGFFALTVFSLFFHKSSILIIPYYFLANKEITKSYRDASIVIILLMIVFRSSIFPIAIKILGYEKYELYESVRAPFLLMFVMLSVLAVWRKDRVIENNPQAIQYYNAMILSGYMLPFAMANPTALRMVYDYFLIVCLLVPEMMLSFEKKTDRTTAYGVTIAIFFIYILTKSASYMFFWE